MSPDARAGSLGALSWKREDAAASIKAVHDHLIQETERQIKWYEDKKKWKAHMSRTLRVGAILLTMIAGLVPAAIGVLEVQTQSYIQLPYLFLGLAAGCVGFDKFFGFSTAWMRKITTSMALERDLAEFQIDWAILNAELQGKPPSPGQVAKLLERLKDLLGTVQDRLEEETKAWVAEFETNLSKLQKDAEAQLSKARAARAGAKSR